MSKWQVSQSLSEFEIVNPDKKKKIYETLRIRLCSDQLTLTGANFSDFDYSL